MNRQRKKQIEEILARPYARVVIPDHEIGGFSASILEFPGCVTQGDTLEEAYASLTEAAEGWLDSVLDLGQAVPEPDAEREYSGKIVIRLPKSTHRRAAQIAETEGVSLNTFLADAVAQRIGGYSTEAAVALASSR